jgi:hypothetical protein
MQSLRRRLASPTAGTSPADDIPKIHDAFISAREGAVSKFSLISEQQGSTVQDMKEAAKEKGV